MGLVNSIMSVMGINDDEFEDIEEETAEEEKEVAVEAPLRQMKSRTAARSNVVEFDKPTTKATTVIVSKPTKFDDATGIVDDFKAKKIVMINIIDLDTKIAQRFLDFVSGACYSLNGDFQEIGKNVYMLVPHNVEVSKEIHKELASKGLFKNFG